MTDLCNTTLVILVNKSGDTITDICLAYKKRGFGKARWNGVGGKLKDATETIAQAARRETKEEIRVEVSELNKVAELNFIFPHQPNWNQLMHVFLVDTWQGKPTETEEMKPQWFKVANIPYANMWPDDKYWLPEVLNGHRVIGEFEFGGGDIIKRQSVTVVDSLN